MDSCGYIYISNFSMEITMETLDEIMSECKEMKGIIIDVRGNSGGNDLYGGRIARRFFDKERLVENLYIKTGPGHNSFTTTTNDKYDLIVYHARSYKKIKGDPLNDPNRHTRVQVLHWNDDGTPDFGVPVPDNAPLDPDKR